MLICNFIEKHHPDLACFITNDNWKQLSISTSKRVDFWFKYYFTTNRSCRETINFKDCFGFHFYQINFIRNNDRTNKTRIKFVSEMIKMLINGIILNCRARCNELNILLNKWQTILIRIFILNWTSLHPYSKINFELRHMSYQIDIR